MNVIAIIPARGGSKRIPQKNIKLFAGKPIIAYPIEQALASNLFDKIIVSTDSEKIAGIAESFGAEVPFLRPAELADDFTGTAPVLLHALQWFEENEISVQYLCCIYPTAPFLQERYLKKGYRLIQEKQASTVFSVTSFPYAILRALRIKDDGKITMFWPEYEEQRSNDLKEAYHDAGQFYWIDAETFKTEKKLFSHNSFPVILPRYLVVDIDTSEDWETAERLYQRLNDR